MHSISLYTIGYENKKLEDFVDKLLQFGVSIVIDVREVPLSRKPGFSKSKLREYLEQYNIKYIHKKELGSPKELRKKLYEDANYEYFFNKYKEYLKERLDVISSLYWDTIVHEVGCLMCMEQEPSYCHRKIVAEKIQEINDDKIVIQHL